MTKYTKAQRKTRRRVYRRQRGTISTFNIQGKPLTPRKIGKIAKARYKSIFD